MYFYDITKKQLDPHLVELARADEVKGVFKHKLFDKVPIQECWNNTNAKPVSTRWVDTNKSDDVEPDYRSRWVGREFKGKDNDRDDLFAATPPLEAKKALIALAACQKGVEPQKLKKLGFVDIRKAYFHAKVKRLIYVELPPEFLEPHEVGKVCGKLNFSLYGTRDAASNWEECYAEFLISIGFKQGLSSPCVFFSTLREKSRQWCMGMTLHPWLRN